MIQIVGSWTDSSIRLGSQGAGFNVLRSPDLNQQRNQVQVQRRVGLPATERAITLEQGFQTASLGEPSHKKGLRLDSGIPANCLRLVPKENYTMVDVRWLNCFLQMKPMMQRVGVGRAKKIGSLGAWLRDLEAEEQVEIGTGGRLGLPF
jgi:hypothetical protein